MTIFLHNSNISETFLVVSRHASLEEDGISAVLTEHQWVVAVNAREKADALVPFRKVLLIVGKHFRTIWTPQNKWGVKRKKFEKLAKVKKN